jgi:DNA-directed RNA polymerase subunit beta
VDLKTLRLSDRGANDRIRATIDAAARERARVEEKAEDQIDKILQPDELPPGVIQLVKVYLGEKRKISVGDKMAGRHGNKGIVARIVPEEDMPFLPDGTPVDIVLNPLGVPSRMNVGQILETHLGWCAQMLGFKAKTPVFRGADEGEIGVLMRLAGLRWAGDGLRLTHKAPAPDAALIDVVVADLKRTGVAGATLDASGIELLAKGGARTKELYEQVKAYLVAAAKELASRQITQRGYEAGYHRTEAGAVGKGRDAALKELEKLAAMDASATLEDTGRPALAALLRGKAGAAEVSAASDELIRAAGLTPAGKVRLRDGRTGLAFESDVTVGAIYMLKLSHLVDDKIHARSIGPYSLVTQQPLAGKAQFGGQRFGEMEVWALEAYGAAHLLQEMLTVKSDDVNGRSKVYEAIVKGQNLPEPGIPESFNVLVKELQALGLKVTLGTTAEGEE